MTQKEFGDFIGRKQSAISQLEDPNYGRETLQTLFEIASRLDVVFMGRFVDYQTFLKWTDDMSEGATRPEPYNQAKMEEIAKPAAVVPSSLPFESLEWRNVDATTIYINNKMVLGALERARRHRPTSLFVSLADAWNHDAEIDRLKKHLQEKDDAIKAKDALIKRLALLCMPPDDGNAVAADADDLRPSEIKPWMLGVAS